MKVTCWVAAALQPQDSNRITGTAEGGRSASSFMRILAEQRELENASGGIYQRHLATISEYFHEHISDTP